MSYSNKNIYNPLLNDIYSDFDVDERRYYDVYEDNFNFPSGYHNYRQVKGCEEYDQPFSNAQIDETAESLCNKFEVMKRNSSYMAMYNNQQQMQSYDRNRNSTKMYNNFGSNYSREFNENVASPTISSSCEPEKVSGSLQAGYPCNENIVHSTTNNSQQGQSASQSDETRSVKIEQEDILKELDSCENNSSLLGATKLEEALPAELIGLTRTGRKFKATEKTEESNSSSPVAKQSAKRLKTYMDVIEDVKEEFAFLDSFSMFDRFTYNTTTTSTEPYAFSVNQYPHNNINQPVDKQKLSFNFAGTSTDYRFGSQPNCNSNSSNYNNVGIMNPMYSNTSHMANYASCSQQIPHTSTPSKMRLQPDCVQMQRAPSTNMNTLHAGISDTIQASYCEDQKYTQSPRKTPLTYHDLDDPSDSNLVQHRQSNNARNWMPNCPYPQSSNIRPTNSGGPEETGISLYSDQGMQRLMQDPRIPEHPLYPLLRDLLINDQKFHENIEPFHFANNLPERFDDLLKNYYMRNRISPVDHRTEPEFNALIIQATRHVHAALVDKMKKRKQRGGFLVQMTKPPAPDINSLCDVMSKSNDLGSNGSITHSHQGMIPIHPPSIGTPGNSHILTAPPTSPTDITQNNYYPPNSIYSGGYQGDTMTNPSTSSQQTNPNNHYQSLTPSSKLRNNYYHHPTTNHQHDYNSQQYSQLQPLYNNTHNNFYTNHPTNNYGESYGMHYQPITRSPMIKHEPAFYSAGDFTRLREMFDPRAMMPNDPRAMIPHDPMLYGTNPHVIHPHLVHLMDGERGMSCSPRRMGRGNPHMMMLKQENEVEKKGKNKVLPKEAVTIMEDWLRKHEDNPYPNDEEKEGFMNQTKLTINQINYWFTNARRRKLPKWNSEKLMAQERMRNHSQPSNQRADEEL